MRMPLVSMNRCCHCSRMHFLLWKTEHASAREGWFLSVTVFLHVAAGRDRLLQERRLHVPDTCPAFRNDKGVAGMERVAFRVRGVGDDEIALDDQRVLVEGIVFDPEGARRARPQPDRQAILLAVELGHARPRAVIGGRARLRIDSGIFAVRHERRIVHDRDDARRFARAQGRGGDRHHRNERRSAEKTIHSIPLLRTSPFVEAWYTLLNSWIRFMPISGPVGMTLISEHSTRSRASRSCVSPRWRRRGGRSDALAASRARSRWRGDQCALLLWGLHQGYEKNASSARRP